MRGFDIVTLLGNELVALSALIKAYELPSPEQVLQTAVYVPAELIAPQ